jgi:hypothetical protein
MGTADDARPPELTVYSRASCHLCEEMIAGLHGMQADFLFTIAVVDVDGDPLLAAQFDTEVPVLAHGTHELCRYRLDPSRVGAYLSGHRRTNRSGAGSGRP